MKRTEKAVTGIVCVLILVIWIASLVGAHRCRVNGGQYVRGLFWYECVRK